MEVGEETLNALAFVEQELSSVEDKLQVLLSLLENPDLLESLPPLHRAASFLSVSKALNAIFTVYLRCKGISPDEHPVNGELERVSLYDTKIEHYINELKGPRHRTTTVNIHAANRVIEHAISDLTEEQRKNLQQLNFKTSQLNSSRKTQKLPVIEPEQTRSLTEAVTTFLEEAKNDLLQMEKKH